MKKLFLYSFLILCLLLGGIIAVPFIFKNRIKEKVLLTIDKQINAEFNFTDISVSPFKNFPHVTITFHDMTLIGKNYFKKDTLAAVNALSVSFELLGIIKGKEIEMRSIHLDKPFIHAIVLKNGLANYDIMLPQDTTGNSKNDTSSFDINVDHWEISEGKLIYDNREQSTYIALDGLNHKGNGDFKEDISDLDITTRVSELTFAYGGVKYFNKKKFKADLLMEMNFKEQKFTFKDHEFEINHFKFGFDGFFKLLETGYETDIRFVVKETSFKNLLSILPGIYLKDMEGIQTKGNFNCNGIIKGIFKNDGTRIPAYHFDIAVKDGMFKYSHLPKAIENINFHLIADNNDGNPDHSIIDLKTFHLDMDKNPVNGKVKINGLSNMQVSADIKAKLNLEDIEKMYPINGIILKGVLQTEIKAEGTYNQTMKTFPVIDAFFDLKNGYIKDKDYPEPMEQIHCNVEMKNNTGKEEDTQILVNTLTYLLDEDPFEIHGSISNLSDYNYDIKAKGLIDLGKITKIYPIESTTLSGTIDADISTQGKLSDITNKQFEKLTAEGTLEAKNVVYISKDLQQPIKITDALLSLSPQKIVLTRFQGVAGKSNISLSGHVFDYMPYILLKSDAIKADLVMQCDTLDINEWMAPAAPVKSKDSAAAASAPMEIIEIPTGLDFVFDSDIKKIKFGTLEIANLDGEIRIKNGVMTLNETGFDAVDAAFNVSGDYDTRDPKHPKFDLVLDINGLDINKAYNTFSTVQSAAPSASKTFGVFSTKYKLKGELAHDFEPILETLMGSGTVVIEDAEVKGLKLFTNISKLTKKQELKDPHVSDIVMNSEIKGGKVMIKPFSFKVSRFMADIEGTQGFDNSISYLIKISVPPLSKVKIPIHVTGTVDNPNVKLGKGHENFNFDEF